MKKNIMLSFLLFASVLKADWAAERLASMSLEEKVGQIFMPSFRMNRPGDYELMIQLITKYYVGGILLLKGRGVLPGEEKTPLEEIELIHSLQRHAAMPLLISQDLEWGLSQCLRQVIRFPYNMTLGAIQNTSLIYELGKEIGRQCKLLGVHINFAPVVDVNSNPKNPVIHARSFGGNINEVTDRALLYMQGMRDAGIISCAKHFPGHGDTEVDSHYDLPVIKHDRAVLEMRELYPFKKMIQADVPMIMTAHLHIPALDDTANLPSSLSKPVVTDLLKNELGFKGIVVTDGLTMQGVSKYLGSGQAAVMAVLAGNDLLIDSEDPIEAINAVIKAIEDGIIKEEQINESALKIVRAKQWAGLDQYQEQPVPSIEQFHIPYAYQLKGRLFDEAITLVRDKDQLLPIMPSATCAALFIEAEKKALHKRADATAITVAALDPDPTAESVNAVENKLQPFETVVVGVFGMNKFAHKQFGISDANLALIKRLQGQGKHIVVALFGTPYAVPLFEDIGTVLVVYEDDIDAQFAAARVITGKAEALGRLPV